MLAVIVLLFVFLLAFSGTPLFAIMAIGAIFGFLYIADVDIAIVIQEAYRLASAPALIAIPLFTLAGYILAESRAPQRLLRFTKAWVGWLPGGVPLVVLVATSIFTALTGASGVTIVALGGLLLPILRNAGYSEIFSLGIITATGSIGLLFPPSLPIILYGVISQAPVNEIFIAGLIPGLTTILIFFIYSVVVTLFSGGVKTEKFDLKEAISATKDAIFEIPLPLFIIFGIYTGLFTASEAATITAIWAIIVEVLIYRDIKLKDFPKVAKESMLLVGAIFAILSMAMGFTNFLIDQQIPQRLFEISQQFIKSRETFFIVLNLFLLVVGMLMDIFSAIVVVVPLIVPVALKYGIDPVHLAVVFLLNLEIGYLTPPVGLNLFISAFRFGKPITFLYRVSVRFIFLFIAALILVTYVPTLSLHFVRGVVKGKVVGIEEKDKEVVMKIPEANIEFKITPEKQFKFFVPLPDFSKPHKYLITFEAEGYKPLMKEVTVKRASSVDLGEIKLEKEESRE
jgi:C4-dicarboxylate transporter DctM subunit